MPTRYSNKLWQRCWRIASNSTVPLLGRFAQHGLRNAGQLVCIDPSLGMAEFISNSAILNAVRPRAALAVAPNSGLGSEKMADLQRKSAN